MNILFVCSRNKKRSRTAETIFRNHPHHKVASAGTEQNAHQKLSERLVSWADIIFVMEKVHKEKLVYKYKYIIEDRPIVILNIPDEYEYMDEELISMLQDMVGAYLQDH